MSDLTRFAVMQHLGVLQDAHLVLVRREGRSRFNYSNPSVLRDLYDQWVQPLANRAAEAAQHLRRYAQSQQEEIRTVSEETYRRVLIELETPIAASPEVVYRAMTEGWVNWWPHRMKEDAELYYDNVIGGTFGERWPGGGGVVYGTLMMLDPGRRIQAVGVGMFGDYTAVNTETIRAEGNGTLHTKSMHLWGHVTPEIETMLRDGSRQLIQDSMRSYCEAMEAQR